MYLEEKSGQFNLSMKDNPYSKTDDVIFGTQCFKNSKLKKINNYESDSMENINVRRSTRKINYAAPSECKAENPSIHEVYTLNSELSKKAVEVTNLEMTGSKSLQNDSEKNIQASERLFSPPSRSVATKGIAENEDRKQTEKNEIDSSNQTKKNLKSKQSRCESTLLSITPTATKNIYRTKADMKQIKKDDITQLKKGLRSKRSRHLSLPLVATKEIAKTEDDEEHIQARITENDITPRKQGLKNKHSNSVKGSLKIDSDSSKPTASEHILEPSVEVNSFNVNSSVGEDVAKYGKRVRKRCPVKPVNGIVDSFVTEVSLNGSQSGNCSGLLKIKPEGEKRPQRLNDHDILYTVIKGKAEVVVNGITYTVTEFRNIKIRKGQIYSIKNLYKRSVLLMNFCNSS